MSRTYRRKKVTKDQILESFCYQYKECPLEYIRNCSRTCSFRNDKYTVSKYRTDTRSGYGWNGNAPKRYTKALNQERRAKDRAEVSRIIRHMDYDGYSFDKWTKDAGYFYW